MTDIVQNAKVIVLPSALQEIERRAYEAGWAAGREAEATGNGIGRDMIRFAVEGNPAPKGSHRGFIVNGQVVISNVTKETKVWEAAVALMARGAMRGRDPFDLPMLVRVVFYMDRPKKPKFKGRPAVPPDLDKLLRSTLDGMTGIVWKDDSRVCEIRGSKRFDTGKGTGAWISVEVLE